MQGEVHTRRVALPLNKITYTLILGERGLDGHGGVNRHYGETPLEKRLLPITRATAIKLAFLNVALP